MIQTEWNKRWHVIYMEEPGKNGVLCGGLESVFWLSGELGCRSVGALGLVPPPPPLNGPGRGRPWKQAPTAVHFLFFLKTGPLR